MLAAELSNEQQKQALSRLKELTEEVSSSVLGALREDQKSQFPTSLGTFH